MHASSFSGRRSRGAGPFRTSRASRASGAYRAFGLTRRIFLLIAIAFPLGCGDDGPGGIGPGDRERARALLTTALPAAIEAKDAADYSALLHPAYRFTFAEGDAPGDLPEGFWGKESEGSAIGSLFADGDVADVAFGVAILGDSLAEVSGSDGTWEYRAAAIVEARIASGEPGDTVTAASAEAYILRIDSMDGEWKIYDETEIVEGKSAAPSAADVRWGETKALYYEPLAPPSSRTVTGSVHFLDGEETPVEGATVTAGSAEATTDPNGFFAFDGIPSSVTSCSVTHPGALFTVFGIGGGDEVYRIDVGVLPHTFQGTPNEMIEHEFPYAYSTRDSVRYASLLDSRYLFELLPEEVDPDMPNPWWDLAEELAIAGKMFKGRFGEDGVRAQSIHLDLTTKTLVVDNTLYSGKPVGETWYRATATVDLRVVAEDPSSSDGSGITNFIVNSDQIFVLRPDPAYTGHFLVYKQTDQGSISGGKGESGMKLGTEDTSWGSVKALWR
jgi:hypothetical protein